MSAAVRPIHVPGVRAVEALRQRAQRALDEWAPQWVTGWSESARHVIELRVSIERVEQEHPYEPVGAVPGCMWVRSTATDRLAFARAVVGEALMPRSACADDWISGVTDHAWGARNRTLCQALLGELLAQTAPAGALPGSVFAFGSGAVQVSCDSLGLQAIVDAAIWKSVPPAQRAARPLTKPTPLDRAAQRAVVRLDVVLGSVEVDLPKVLDLQCGDVLLLPQRLSQPLPVLCNGKALARGVLGAMHGRKSVQLLASHQ